MHSEVAEKVNVGWNYHNGVKYLLVDFSGLNERELLSITFEISALMKEEGEGNVRLISDLSGLTRETNAYSSGRNFAKSHQKYVYKSAVTGLPFWLKPLYNIYMKFTGSKSKLFKTMDESIEYVCS